MSIQREALCNIRENYAIWKRIIELDYNLLGLADNVFTSPVKYYFCTKGFGIILSRDILIVSGNDRNKIRNEVNRLKKKVNIKKSAKED